MHLMITFYKFVNLHKTMLPFDLISSGNQFEYHDSLFDIAFVQKPSGTLR